MKIIPTDIDGLLIIEPDIFEDDRGYFYESYNKKKFDSLGVFSGSFVQDNQSKSNKGVVRGLHFQKAPFAQGKLVRVVSGSVLDVAIDLRRDSKTSGNNFSVNLTGDNKKMFWVPEGFAHGFSTLEDGTIFSYKCTNYYHKDSECCILWNDYDLNIDWGVLNPIVSEKDKNGIKFSDFELYGG
jgi:dTDP-4-dehydrorhamnose 3,5-epimerase